MSNIQQTNQPTSSASQSPSPHMSVWFLELERLLERVENAATHFQTLGVGRLADREEILLSFQQTLGFLFPIAELLAALPPETLQRMDQALEKSTQAFVVIGSFNRRREYEQTLGAEQGVPVTKPADREPGRIISAATNLIEQVRSAPLPFFNRRQNPAPATPVTPPPAPAVVAPPLRADKTQSRIGGATGPLEIKPQITQREVFSEFGRRQDENRRRCERFKMKLPVRVTGHDRQSGKWQAMVETTDVSRTGVQIVMQQRVIHNTILQLSLPLPVRLRAHGFAEQSYNVYAIVRRILPQIGGRRLVGLEFIGENPPSGYHEKPWAVCRTRQWVGVNRRRHQRFEIVEAVSIEFLTADKKLIVREQGITENISRGGARVKATIMPPEFELVRITAPQCKFDSLAVVTSRYLGPDGTARACLQFIEREWPVAEN
jgi:hypothetical protein